MPPTVELANSTLAAGAARRPARHWARNTVITLVSLALVALAASYVLLPG
jgi:hypothetical protein